MGVLNILLVEVGKRKANLIAHQNANASHHEQVGNRKSNPKGSIEILHI